MRAWETERGIADVVVMMQKAKVMYMRTAVKRMEDGSLHRGGAWICGWYGAHVGVANIFACPHTLSPKLHDHWFSRPSAIVL